MLTPPYRRRGLRTDFLFKEAGADCIVAIGGGSAMDTAKAIGIIIENPEFADVHSLEGVADTKNQAFFCRISNNEKQPEG